MKMDYPRISYILDIDKIEDNTYELTNLSTGDCWRVSEYLAWFISGLNGKTDPYSIDPALSREQVDEILEFLDVNELLFAKKRVRFDGFGCVYLALLFPGGGLLDKIAKWLNRMMMIGCVPIFVGGIYIFLTESFAYVRGAHEWLLGGVIGLLIGILFHEFSHAVSCIAYNGTVYEFGVALHHFMPAAYVQMNDTAIASPFMRGQIYTAGIEANLLLSGAFLCLLKAHIPSTMLVVAAFMNVLLVILNLSLIDGYDGNHIFCEIIGIDDFVQRAKMLLTDKKERELLHENGINKYLVLMSCLIILGIQILIPVIMILSITSVLILFI